MLGSIKFHDYQECTYSVCTYYAAFNLVFSPPACDNEPEPGYMSRKTRNILLNDIGNLADISLMIFYILREADKSSELFAT